MSKLSITIIAAVAIMWCAILAMRISSFDTERNVLRRALEQEWLHDAKFDPWCAQHRDKDDNIYHSCVNDEINKKLKSIPRKYQWEWGK
jgi:hypothetical protein